MCDQCDVLKDKIDEFQSELDATNEEVEEWQDKAVERTNAMKVIADRLKDAWKDALEYAEIFDRQDP